MRRCNGGESAADPGRIIVQNAEAGHRAVTLYPKRYNVSPAASGMQERRRTWISAIGISPRCYGEGPGLGRFQAVDAGFAGWKQSAPHPLPQPLPVRMGRGILSRRVAGDPLDFQEIIEAVF